MDSEENKVSAVPCSYHIGKDDAPVGSNEIRVTEKTALVVPADDANDKKILCSSKYISKARKHLSEARDGLKKSSSFLADICSAIFGAIISLLASLWVTLDPYSKVGFWTYIILIVLAFITGGFWFYLRKYLTAVAHNNLNIILDDFLPDPENIEPVVEE